MRSSRHPALIASLVILLSCAFSTGPLALESSEADTSCCDLEALSELLPGIVWIGSDRMMTIEKLAAYCAPVLWFSRDEPLLKEKTGTEITMPTAFPFQESDGTPVVYYRVRRIMYGSESEGTPFTMIGSRSGDSLLDLELIQGIDLDYYFYYPEEEGFGGHAHDVEAAEFKLGVFRDEDCDECRYIVMIAKITAKAHGVLWFDNILVTDKYSKFPIHLLVEEGKHACCTDKNADGYYTPGYDVNVNVNDAWGVRDVIRGGTLFTGSYQAWFSKVRSDPTRVFPPLPEDSMLRERYMEYGVYARRYAKYELRTFPNPDEAAYDPVLFSFIKEKEHHDWPELEEVGDFEDLLDWAFNERIVKSISLAYRYDGDHGISLSLPLFVFKSMYEPLGGGWLVSRFYLKDKKLRDFGYNVLYTRSASSWIGAYFSLGFERDNDGTRTTTKWASETGFKFRANIAHSPFRFMAKLTPFWGFRVGIKSTGVWDIDDIGYVVALGAGSW